MTELRNAVRHDANYICKLSRTKHSLIFMLWLTFLQNESVLGLSHTTRKSSRSSALSHLFHRTHGMCLPMNFDNDSKSSNSRRSMIKTFTANLVITTAGSFSEWAVADDRGFVSAAFLKSEYTNSIVASRDTNISPKEVYDSILSLKADTKAGQGRALDVGAGAGVSTQVLYQQMNFKDIDAIDWSGDAWDLNVGQNGNCPSSVRFYEIDDERFYRLWKQNGMKKYDVIVFNFAVNKDKALKFARDLLTKDGLLLAPINTQQDYWMKQKYELLNADGRTLWSANDVGAWSVQFQPDVTQDTCQGIWCSPYNGFKKQ